MTTPLPPAPGPTDSDAEPISACPACGSESKKFLLWGRSRYHETWYQYWRCNQCTLVYVNPRRAMGNQLAEVEGESVSQDIFSRKEVFDCPEVRWNMIRPIQKLLSPNLPDGKKRRWLDIGCAVGNLLLEAHRARYEPFGLELNRAMVDWAEAHRPELKIQQGLLSDLLAHEKFDVISADNVLEHIHDPREFLKDLHARMKPDSLLIVRVPNFNVFIRPLLEITGRLARSYILDPDAHPCNYSRRSLHHLLERSGFDIERTMEHLMLSYPLKHILDSKTSTWSSQSRTRLAKVFKMSFAFDRIIQRGGIDITVIARSRASPSPPPA